MFLNKKITGGVLLGIGALLLVGGVFGALSMPIVGLPIVGLGVLLMVGGIILVRKSKIVMINSPLNPNLERSEESGIYSSSFDGRAQNVPQLTDDQREGLMLKLQARLLSEEELRKGVENLLIPKQSEETRFAIVKSLFTQMRLLLNDCRRLEIEQVMFADNIKKLAFLRGFLKKDSYQFVPSLLLAPACKICDAVKELLKSKEYREAMPQENEAGERTSLLGEAKNVVNAMQTLVRSQSFTKVERAVEDGIEAEIQTRQEKQHANDSSVTSAQVSEEILGFH
ncbi:MAG: hypothetical protein AMJ43_06050 [Coxiella sp. DG_40]|nr:MAG: hypothetical protein AMJ43_06050 [Coxiella sp. DG_40]